MERTNSYVKNASQHVIPNPDGGWIVKKNGAVKATKRFQTKAAAIRYARRLGKLSKSIVFIHAKDGRVLKTEEFLG